MRDYWSEMIVVGHRRWRPDAEVNPFGRWRDRPRYPPMLFLPHLTSRVGASADPGTAPETAPEATHPAELRTHQPTERGAAYCRGGRTRCSSDQSCVIGCRACRRSTRMDLPGEAGCRDGR